VGEVGEMGEVAFYPPTPPTPPPIYPPTLSPLTPQLPMLNSTQMPPRMFSLEGTFLGFLGGDAKKPKSLVLDVDQEHIAIKLPKELRSSIPHSAIVGDRLRCIGCSEVDYKAGIIKLRAYQVFFLPPSDSKSAVLPPCTTTVESANTLPCGRSVTTDIAPAAKTPKNAQILVCHKSGCQKRGGRKMVTALEQVLQEYQLQNQVEIRYTGCQKRCSKAPNLTVMPGKHRYDNLSPKDLTALVQEHFCPS
jgi:(2Fe-2S) ferredoxin